LFVTVLFITILLSIPGQSCSVLGVEFVALAVISGVGLLMLDRRARADTHQRAPGAHAIALIMDAIAPNAITSILLLVAGVLLILVCGQGSMSWSCPCSWPSPAASRAPGSC
jgi:hypothetical protein